MIKTDRDQYDVIIIGAGIGGLVCGCYLARAGMKALIVERHNKPGGYCTSFRRHGLTFDAAAHSLGGLRYGNVGKIFKDLGIDAKLKLTKVDPSDIVATPDYNVSFWADLEKTIEGLQNLFPDEASNISKFIHFLVKPDPLYFARIRSWTFKKLLDFYFRNEKLKSTLSFPVFGNGGLPPSLMSAFIGAKIFKEYILDGGYHPDGGMQSLSNALAEKFREFGGDLRLSSTVKKIEIKNKEVKGIFLEEDGFKGAHYVISNSDARETFLTLLGKEVITRDFFEQVNKMTPALSTFIVYMGLNQSATLPNAGINNWYLSQYDLSKMYFSIKKGNLKDIAGYLVHISPDKSTLMAFINAPFKTERYWNSHRKNISTLLIKTINRYTVPDLSNNIIYEETATPHTLHRYTLNYQGSAYGWESTPSQLGDPEFRKPSFVKGLYLTGHWTTCGLGIPGVMYISYDTANLILKKDARFSKLC